MGQLRQAALFPRKQKQVREKFRMGVLGFTRLVWFTEELWELNSRSQKASRQCSRESFDSTKEQTHGSIVSSYWAPLPICRILWYSFSILGFSHRTATFFRFLAESTLFAAARIRFSWRNGSLGCHRTCTLVREESLLGLRWRVADDGLGERDSVDSELIHLSNSVRGETLLENLPKFQSWFLQPSGFYPTAIRRTHEDDVWWQWDESPEHRSFDCLWRDLPSLPEGEENLFKIVMWAYVCVFSISTIEEKVI